MARSQETFNKKEVRNKKEKKRKEKEQKRLARKEHEKKGSLEDMIAYVDEKGRISSTPPDPGKKETIKVEDIAIGTPRNTSPRNTEIQRKGIVIFFNEAKGFGFIKDSETQEKIFVHVNNMLEEIKEGNVVSFMITSGFKGRSATQVKLIKQ